MIHSRCNILLDLEFPGIELCYQCSPTSEKQLLTPFAVSLPTALEGDASDFQGEEEMGKKKCVVNQYKFKQTIQ